MKKIGTVLILGMLTLSLAGCGDPCKEDPMTSLGDSLATIGKKGAEKEQILMERQAKRAAACTEKKAKEVKKDLGF